MNMKNTTSLLALAALLATTAVAGAATTGNGNATYDAAVSILSPDQSGFIIGGQVSVNGLGSGSVTLSRAAAQTQVTGSAASGLSTVQTPGIPELSGVNSASGITSSIVFNRDIATSGSLVGQGSVTARGEAIASLGTAGAASANTTVAGTDGQSAEGSATSTSSSQGSLNGSLSTANGLQLLGTSGLFAGSNALTVGETNTALAYGTAHINADTSTTGIALNNASTSAGGNGLLSGTGDGALFSVGSVLHGGQDPTIGLSVSNAGNGTIAVTTSTGGFFTGGAATGGSSALSQSGNFFATFTN